ncbi:MAG TPA: LuxR C-terminal-related transcriptional regulator [Candidatus Saccharimonadales bacterium]|nr:LuxR C-terminal-related transcriptional regulator [Candidatus Saccharimonadales bacterium]
MQPPTRELEILLAVAKGDSHEEIARNFGISEMSVKASLVKTRERYGAVNNEEAIGFALAARHIPLRKGQNPGTPLNQAEVDFLSLVAGGNQDEDLEKIYFCSRKLIDNYMKVIIGKLDAVNRCNAIYKGFRYGLLIERGERYYAKHLRNSQADALLASAVTASLEEAAAILCLKPSTVKTHLQHCRRRLIANTTPHAVAIAIHNGELFCPPADENSAKTLEWRERQALINIAQGYSDPDSAAMLKIGVRTLTRAVASAIEKLEATGRENAVFKLFQQGVLK